MPVTDYYTVNGELLGEKTSGGPRTDYLSDALGSVVATVNPSAQVLNTYRYKPYGAQLAKTGVGADPAFRWVGGLGYRQTGKAWSDVYVRARHYDTSSGRWTSRDPVRRQIAADRYAYADASPALLSDSMGLSAGACMPEASCCADADRWFRSPTMTELCPGGRWNEARCALFRDSGPCHGEMRIQKTKACMPVLQRLQQALAVCNGQQPPGGPGGGNVPVTPRAYTMCCFDADGPHFCQTRCCTSTYPPPLSEAREGRACMLFCLMQHEDVHAQQCLGAKRPDNYQDPRHFPHEEPCGWGAEALCLYTLYNAICHDLWAREIGDGLFASVERCRRTWLARCAHVPAAQAAARRS